MAGHGNTYQRRVIELVSLAFLGLSMAVGLAAQDKARDAFKGSKELRSRAAKALLSIDKYAHQLDGTERSLVRLSKADQEFPGRYGSFADNLQRLERSQSRAAADIEKMTMAGTSYFAKWDQANLEIADPEMRRASVEERFHMMRRFEHIKRQVTDTAFGLPTMNNHLHDLNAFLGSHITAESVRTASDMIRSCREEIKDLRKTIAELHEMLKQFLADAPR